jgi:hypothetical protein
MTTFTSISFRGQTLVGALQSAHTECYRDRECYLDRKRICEVSKQDGKTEENL